MFKQLNKLSCFGCYGKMVSVLPNKNNFRLGWRQVHEVATMAMKLPQSPLG
jgi:hypothetical protein